MSTRSHEGFPYGIEPGIVDRLPPDLFRGLEARIRELHRQRPWRRLGDFAFYVTLWLAGSAVLLGHVWAGDRSNLLVHALGTLLAALGLYGLLAHLVAQSSREIGIQLALGASSSWLLRRIVGRGLALAGTGILVGLTASLFLGRFLESRLFEVSASDPWTLTGCALLLGIVAVVSSYLPAKRATRLDPVVALRQP